MDNCCKKKCDVHKKCNLIMVRDMIIDCEMCLWEVQKGFKLEKTQK